MSVMYLWTHCDPAGLSASFLPVLAEDTSWSTALSREPLVKALTLPPPLSAHREDGERFSQRDLVHFPKGEMVWTTLKVVVICISCDLSVRPLHTWLTFPWSSCGRVCKESV